MHFSWVHWSHIWSTPTSAHTQIPSYQYNVLVTHLYVSVSKVRKRPQNSISHLKVTKLPQLTVPTNMKRIMINCFLEAFLNCPMNLWYLVRTGSFWQSIKLVLIKLAQCHFRGKRDNRSQVGIDVNCWLKKQITTYYIW